MEVAPLPFELVVLEVALGDVCTVLGRLARELELQAHPAVEALTKDVRRCAAAPARRLFRICSTLRDCSPLLQNTDVRGAQHICQGIALCSARMPVSHSPSSRCFEQTLPFRWSPWDVSAESSRHGRDPSFQVSLPSLCAGKNLLELRTRAALTLKTNPVFFRVQVSTVNLERVRKVKTRHQRLLSRVTTVREELERFLEDDDDMAKMCLTRRREVPHRSLTQVVKTELNISSIVCNHPRDAPDACSRRVPDASVPDDSVGLVTDVYEGGGP